MRPISAAIAGAALALTLTGCNLTTPQPGGAPTGANAYEMEDVVWVAPAFDDATLQFSGGQMSGQAPCNGYSGENLATWPAFDFDAGEVAVTLMACPNDALETAFFAALRAATRAAITGDGALVLSNAAGPLIRFEPS